METISRNFGTLFIDGQPSGAIQLRQPAEDLKIEIGNSDGKYIPWVVVGNLLVAKCELVLGVSWNMLLHNKLVEGREISIDRLSYRIRLLRRGEDVEDLGEFEQYLKTLGGLDNTAYPQKRVWLDDSGLNAGDRKNGSWIPVLEPIQPDLAEATGENIVIWTKTGEFVTGNLVEVNEYDLLLASGLCLADDGSSHSPWVSSSGFCMAVDREGIWSLQAYNKEAV